MAIVFLNEGSPEGCFLKLTRADSKQVIYYLWNSLCLIRAVLGQPCTGKTLPWKVTIKLILLGKGGIKFKYLKCKAVLVQNFSFVTH